MRSGARARDAKISTERAQNAIPAGHACSSPTSGAAGVRGNPARGACEHAGPRNDEQQSGQRQKHLQVVLDERSPAYALWAFTRVELAGLAAIGDE